MDTKTRIGIFSGTFDPPHPGHLAIAEAAASQLQLDRVLWVLTPAPPHKQMRPITAVEHRAAMVSLAIAGEPKFELCSVDLDRPGPYYSVNTLEILHRQNPKAELVFILGSDLLPNLPYWIEVNKLVSLCYEIAVAHRPGSQADLGSLDKSIPGIAAKICVLSVPCMDVSSHEIRERCAKGDACRGTLPQSVAQYISDHKLYASQNG